MVRLIFRFFPRLQLAWFFLLPWAGYVAALRVAPDVDPLKSTILIGWSTLFVYQFVKLGIIQLELSQPQESRDWKASLQLLPMLVPSATIGINQLLLGGGWSSYFLEEYTMEVAALVVAITGTILVGQNRQGRTAWQDLGAIPLVFLMVAAGTFGVVATWWGRNDYAHADKSSVALVSAGLLLEIRHQLRVMGPILRREIVIRDFVGEPWGTFVILGQLVLWVALPLVRYL